MAFKGDRTYLSTAEREIGRSNAKLLGIFSSSELDVASIHAGVRRRHRATWSRMSDRGRCDWDLRFVLDSRKRRVSRVFLVNFVQCIEGIRKIDLGIIHLLVEAYSSSSIFIIPRGITNVASDARIEGGKGRCLLGWGRNHVSLSKKLLAEAMNVLHDCRTR
jgi:hypothetical protein